MLRMSVLDRRHKPVLQALQAATDPGDRPAVKQDLPAGRRGYHLPEAVEHQEQFAFADVVRRESTPSLRIADSPT